MCKTDHVYGSCLDADLLCVIDRLTISVLLLLYINTTHTNSYTKHWFAPFSPKITPLSLSFLSFSLSLFHYYLHLFSYSKHISLSVQLWGCCVLTLIFLLFYAYSCHIFCCQTYLPLPFKLTIGNLFMYRVCVHVCVANDRTSGNEWFLATKRNTRSKNYYLSLFHVFTSTKTTQLVFTVKK